MSIPKIIHMIWIGPDPFPYQKNLDLYKKYHPKWSFKLWTDENLPKLKNQAVYDAIDIYATKADLLRLELLLKYGGVYVDTDSYCVRPLDSLIKNKTCFFTTNHKGKVEVNLIGCEAGNKLIKKLVDGAQKYWQYFIFKEKQRRLYCIYNYIRKRLNKSKNFIKLTQEYNCPLSKRTSKTYVIQNMDHNWVQTEEGDI